MDYVIADLHFGHKNIVGYCRAQFQSLAEMESFIVQQWNSVVTKQDRVYVLGDVAFGAKGLELCDYLEGNKILIAGNHDNTIATTDYLRYFTRVRGAQSYHLTGSMIIMTHIPVHPDCLERYSHNLHGHLHTKRISDPRYINVSCEQLNFTPKPILELINNVH